MKPSKLIKTQTVDVEGQEIIIGYYAVFFMVIG